MNRVDVLILTALQDELDAVLHQRPGFREARDDRGARYHEVELQNAREKPLRIAAAWLGGMGETTAALRATTLVRELDPACLAMCGICAGKRGEVSLGDVIVADRVYGYDHGKLVAGEGEGAFLHDIETYNLDAAWREDASTFARELGWASELARGRPIAREAQARWVLHALSAHESGGAPSPMTNPERRARCPDWAKVVGALQAGGLVVIEGKSLRLTGAGRARVQEEELLFLDDGLPAEAPFRVHIGPIATGKAVREDPGIFDKLSKLVRKTIGVEMEAAAIGQVAAHLGRRAIVVKAVSDHADHEKDDAYRVFAARASAAWLFAFLERHYEPTGSPTDPRQSLAAELERAYQRRGALRAAGASSSAVDREILEIKRKLREGGHLRAGDSLGDGRYLLVDEVGRGGFGYVLRALDRETKTEVAIKVLHSAVAADPARRERFFRGARIMQELDHPAVVRVLERHGEDGGFHYFVMELVDGHDLRQAVLLGEARGEAALPLILEVGGALAAAHAKKLVHRDVKPANILVGAEGKPKLTDFDLVMAHDTTGGTKSGALGTFVYAAPECLHHPQDATARADVFGLGMSAVFVLHGQELPMDVVRDAAGFIEKLSCSDAVKIVLKKAAAWNAAERFADAGEFCRALGEASQQTTRKSYPH